MKYVRQIEETAQDLVIANHGEPVLSLTPIQPASGAPAEGPERLRDMVALYEKSVRTGGAGELGRVQMTLFDTHL